MSRQSEIDRIIATINDEQFVGNIIAGRLAIALVDNGIGTKDRFEIDMKKGETKRLLAQHNIDMSDGAKFLECWLRKSIVQPIDYKE